MPSGRFPVSPYWSSNPNIPIYLDQTDECDNSSDHENSRHQHTHSRHDTEYICPTCETSSRDTPIHCVSVAPSPSPPSYSSITPKAPPYRQHLAVPTLTIETPRESWSRPQAPRRTLQIDPEGRPHVRFRRNAFSPLSPTPTEFDEREWGRKSRIGLGIPDAPFQADSSPVTPGTVEKRGEQDPEGPQSASNFAQRVEQKLWNYTASRNVVKRWLIEIVSWSLSAACMAGIVIMLIVYKNKRIPDWPLGLTLNAYVSVLAKVASASLLLPVSEALGQLKWSWFQGDNSKKMWDFELFDSASRGPWGSLLLLIRTRGKSLAALGAAVTIFALALDPFFQQVVEYPEVWRLQTALGAIPVATGYEPFSKGQEYRNGNQNLDSDKTMSGVLARFFYDNGTAPLSFGRGIRAEIPLACPHSNCTWGPYETLGVHSECVDAADQLEFRCEKTTLDWVQHPIVDTVSDNDYTFPNGTACGWWLKAKKPLLMTGYSTDRKGEHANETLISRTEALYDIFSREFMGGYNNKLNNSRDPLSHMVIVSGQDVESIHNNRTPIAHECIVSWAVKTIESSYSEGGYFENVTEVKVNSTTIKSPWVTEIIPNESNAMILYDYKFMENATIESDSGRVFSVDNNTHLLTVSIFDDAFPSYFTLSNSTDILDAMLRYKRYLTIVTYTRNVTYNPMLFSNVSTHLDHMATAMTNVLRAAAIDTEMVYGESWDKESVVDVRWPWLSLPLGLLFFTGIFLLGTVIRSSREQDKVGVWKTSAIAGLLYGFDDDMSKKMQSEKAEGTPRAKAKEMKVKWIPQRGWRFSGNSVSPTSLRNFIPTSPIQRPKSPTPSTKARQSPPTERSHWI
jgi:hypothetical protein